VSAHSATTFVVRAYVDKEVGRSLFRRNQVQNVMRLFVFI
jgi:hypothetical protein